MATGSQTLPDTSLSDVIEQMSQMEQGFGEENMDPVSSLQEYVRKAQEKVQGFIGKKEKVQGAKTAGDIAEQEQEVKNNVSLRLHYLQYFLKFDDKYQHNMLREWITSQFTIMYTKQRSSADTCLGLCLFHVLLPGLALASVVLFAMSNKDGYSKSDITVTYMLFSGTIMVEFAVLWQVPCLGIIYGVFLWFQEQLRNGPDPHPPPDRGDELPFGFSWTDMVSQHNIMLFCARRKRPTALMKLAAVGCLRDYINKHWYIWHEPAAQQISVLVRRHTEYGWKEYIHDAARYKRFNNFRGDHTLRKHQLLGEEQLGWSINLPFDECVLVWHIATDLCLHHTNSTSNTTTASFCQSQGTSTTTIESHRSSSEVISNYMVYLLFICPDMPMLGTRQDLFMHACGDIERMIQDLLPSSSHDKRSITQRILTGSTGATDVEQDGGGGELVRGAVSMARALAQKLIDGVAEEERWEVIQGVWVEMLCYSASRCRGYEHAKSLAHGGEFLTNVWLLWSVMGMETLPDKMHNLGPPEPDPAPC